MRRQRAWAILAIASMVVAAPSVRAQAPEGFLLLKSNEVFKVLVGKLISYNPPNSADMGVHEEFHPDGMWRGILYGRGPVPFSGRWSINANQMCVTADRGAFAERWHSGQYCRQVWKNQISGELLIGYLPDQPSSPRKMGLQVLTVGDLTTLR